MSLRMYCPGCDSELSSIRAAFMAGNPCPNCSLSATAAEEILAVRARQGDEKLKAELEAALKRVDELEKDNRRLLWKVAHVHQAVSEEPPTPFG